MGAARSLSKFLKNENNRTDERRNCRDDEEELFVHVYFPPFVVFLFYEQMITVFCSQSVCILLKLC